MDVIKVLDRDIPTTIHSFIAKKRSGIAYCIHDTNSVCTTPASVVDKALCAELGYEILEAQRNGGVFVSSIGDIGIIHVGNIGNRFVMNFASFLIQKLSEKGLTATFDNNDVLVDGYKIGGITAFAYPTKQLSSIHIGINTNLDDIKAICTKPMVKVPKGLGEYGVTSEEIENWFLDYCEANK